MTGKAKNLKAPPVDYLLHISRPPDVLVTLRYENDKVVIEGKDFDKGAKIFFETLKKYIDEYIKRRLAEPSDKWIAEKANKMGEIVTDILPRRGTMNDPTERCKDFIRNLFKEAREEKDAKKR